MKRTRRSGFTLIDTLMAIAIIVILLGAVFYLLDPIKQINKFRNARRLRDVQAIASAVNLYYQDYGAWPEIPQTWTMIGSETANCSAACGSGYGLKLVVSPGYIRIPGEAFNFTQSGEFTFSMWLKPDPRPPSDTGPFRRTALLYKPSAGDDLYPGYGLGIWYMNSKAYVYSVMGLDNGSWSLKMKEIPISEFSHVIFMYKDSDVFLYVNGDSELWSDSGPLLPGSFANNGDLYIGGTPPDQDGSETFPYLGIVDDIRVFDQALNEEEVQTLFTGEDTSQAPIARWTFDEGAGTTIEDQTQNNHDGTFIDFEDENWEINTPGDFAAGGGRTASVCISLADELSEYLATVPNDPLEEESALTGYAIKKNGSIVSVVSCHSDGEGRGGEEPYPLIEVSL